jgi:hypothetical protein
MEAAAVIAGNMMQFGAAGLVCGLLYNSFQMIRCKTTNKPVRQLKQVFPDMQGIHGNSELVQLFAELLPYKSGNDDAFTSAIRNADSLCYLCAAVAEDEPSGRDIKDTAKAHSHAQLCETALSELLSSMTHDASRATAQKHIRRIKELVEGTVEQVRALCQTHGH